MGKKKIYKILVVGSGLSSLSFIDSYLKKNNKIDVISFDNKKIDITNIKNKHIYKILPPQMIGQEKNLKSLILIINI